MHYKLYLREKCIQIKYTHFWFLCVTQWLKIFIYCTQNRLLAKVIQWSVQNYYTLNLVKVNCIKKRSERKLQMVMTPTNHNIFFFFINYEVSKSSN
jgi:hypothetical protein